ncbi:hypothetical protein KIN20_022610 [Parelaphostrongylus tenuis]|uniref:C2H2-type domain-containing protein n=1 Tax=Parelaphostrongylus tenuis TaxID=148309 RepID=A0AAD5QVF9_PARTN|nr:hypothetical protein KIN20_022610 [Parelaphostrongylus tenuis]
MTQLDKRHMKCLKVVQSGPSGHKIADLSPFRVWTPKVRPCKSMQAERLAQRYRPVTLMERNETKCGAQETRSEVYKIKVSANDVVVFAFTRCCGTNGLFVRHTTNRQVFESFYSNLAIGFALYTNDLPSLSSSADYNGNDVPPHDNLLSDEERDKRHLTCGNCGRNYARRFGLRTHQRVIHNKQLLMCPYEGCDHSGFKYNQGVCAIDLFMPSLFNVVLSPFRVVEIVLDNL